MSRRLELIEELKKLEIKRVNLQKLLSGIRHHYCDGGSFSVVIKGVYDPLYKGEKIPFNKSLIIEYIQKEITQTVKEINENIKKLEG